jgi:hypothetical protein
VTVHIRVTSPHQTTETLVGAMAATDGVTSIVVIRDARQPPGDVVQFDVLPSAANTVLRRLRDLGLDRYAPIAVYPVDAVITAARRTRFSQLARGQRLSCSNCC